MSCSRLLAVCPPTADIDASSHCQRVTMPKEGPAPTASAEEMELRLGTALSSEHWPSEVRAPMLIPSICVEKSVYIFRLHFRFRSGLSEGCRQDGKVFGGW